MDAWKNSFRFILIDHNAGYLFMIIKVFLSGHKI